MAVGYDNCTGSGIAAGNPLTFAHLVGGNNRYLIVAVQMTVAVTGVTYAGAAMGLLESTTRSGDTLYVYGLVNPASGNNNVVITAGGNFSGNAIAISYTGVDQNNPVTDSNSTNCPNVTVCGPLACSSGLNDLVVSIASAVANNNCASITNSEAGWTFRCCSDSPGGDRPVRADERASEGLTTDDTWEYNGAGGTKYIAIVSLAPFVLLRGRAVDYYFDIWDPLARVRDIQDRVVPNDEILADRYIEIQGIKLPTSVVHQSFVTDPTKSRIIQVDATPDSATMKAARSQIAEILISRAAGGRA